MHSESGKDMVKLKDIRVGSKVLVSSDFGAGSCVTGIVVDVMSDVKNGLPGIDYTIVGTTDDRWAYLHQVKKVVTF